MGRKDAQASVPFHLDDLPIDALTPQGKRRDGRSHNELRGFFFRVGTVSRAQGSCYAELGSTKVMVGVYGPRQTHRSQGYSDQGSLFCDVKFANFATRQRTESGQSPEEKELSAVLHRSLVGAVKLSAYPKSTINIFVTVLESGGSDVGLVITAAALALADASVELLDAAASCCVSRHGQYLLLDPTGAEEAAAEGTVTLAFLPSLAKVSQLSSTGSWSQTAFNQAVQLAVGGCLRLGTALREVLVASVA